MAEAGNLEQALCLSGLISSWGSRQYYSHSGLPALRGTGPWAGGHPISVQGKSFLVTQQRSVERSPQGSHQTQNSQHRNVSSFSAACPCRWSPKSSAPLSSRPDNVAIEWGSPHPQGLPGTLCLLPPPPAAPATSTESPRKAPCELSGLSGQEGHSEHRGDPGALGVREAVLPRQRGEAMIWRASESVQYMLGPLSHSPWGGVTR